MAIEWDRIEQKGFDRVVEALVVRRYKGNSQVEVIDGRGGDGGRDIVVNQGRRVRIFQLKYFPQGFSSGWARSRRAQIRKSFIEAMAWKPYEWVLVTPANLTPEEREYAINLTCDLHKPVKIRIWGRAELDEQLAVHADLARYFLTELGQLKELINEFGLERAALSDPHVDLPARVSGLAALVDTHDLFWTYDFSVINGRVTTTLRPKNPEAHLTSPVRVFLDLDTRALPESTRLAIRDSVDYGLGGKVNIVGAAVRRFSVSGPDFVKEEAVGGDIEWKVISSAITPGTPAEVRFVDKEGEDIASFGGDVEVGNQGAAGYGISSRFGGRTTTLTLKIPKDAAAAVEVAVGFDGKGASVGDTLRAVRMIRMFHEDLDLQFYVGDHLLCTLSDRRRSESIPEGFDHLERLATDLDVLERHSNQYFPVPKSMTNFELAKLRAAALLLAGRYVVHPEVRVFTVKLNGRNDPALRDALSTGVGAFILEIPRMVITINNRRVVLGLVRLYHPEVEIVGAEQLLRKLDQGAATDQLMKLRPRYGQHFFALMPERFPPTEGQPELSRWGLDNFEEPGLDTGEDYRTLLLPSPATAKVEPGSVLIASTCT